MSIFKCKMCGGTLEIGANQTTAVCEYCGTQQTLPRLDDDRRASLYDRANHFRRNNEYDKAMGIYEKILNEDNTDAEAYWSLVLCHYGIEYVEDPATRKRIPTVNRTQFTSVFDDDNYKSALKYSDAYQRAIYEQEAQAINEIQKGILSISQSEEPFDVFICYKESDERGRRTPDSVLANDLYYQLTQEGFKVFFSRITLEDKLGVAYEPYIFAALNSAKVMVVLGTKPEYFESVWVKNEWSRYLALVKQSGGKKVLIPAYRDMNPYNLPPEFAHLQAQDMGKLGFMQDLIRGIKKLTEVPTPRQAVEETVLVQQESANSVSPLLKRAFLFLEDGDWRSADEYCEKVLDTEPENAEAYLGKLMAELQIHTRPKLKECITSFADNGNYQKALRFADDTLKAELTEYVECVDRGIENRRLAAIYDDAVHDMSAAKSEADYLAAARKFDSISGFSDASVKKEQCADKADRAREQEEDNRKNKIYAEALDEEKKTSIDGLERAIQKYKSIAGWKDADARAFECLTRLKELQALKAQKAKKRKKVKKLIMIPICIILSVLLVMIIASFGITMAHAQKGDVESQMLLAQLCLNVNADEKAAHWYTQAAEQGNAAAQAQLGYMYWNGVGVTKNSIKAAKWATLSAEQGNVTGQYNLGLHYFMGDGIKQDYTKAKEWYLKAAEQNYVEAQYALAKMYSDGNGIERDHAAAFKWYSKAAEQGHAEAQNMVGRYYDLGVEVTEDNAEAVKWYTLSAEQGYATAQYNLATMYSAGNGVSEDENIAFDWFMKAAKQGYADAQNRVGRCYNEGWGVKQNYSEAIKWHTWSAQQGNSDALFNLGAMYYNGEGVQKNLSVAQEYFKMAADLGHEKAKEILESKY